MDDVLTSFEVMDYQEKFGQVEDLKSVSEK